MTERPPVRLALTLLPGALLLLARLRWLHPRRDLHGLVAAATPGPRLRRLNEDRARVALRLSRAVIRRLPRVFKQPCLYWSLAAYHYLCRAEVSPVLHVGVMAEGAELLSHAWVTVNGEWGAGQPNPTGYRQVISLP